EIGSAIQQRVPEPTAPAEACVLRVAPDLGHALAEAPAAPLVGAQRTGPLPLHALLVYEDLQRNPRRAGSRLAPQWAAAVRVREQTRPRGADVVLGQQRQVRPVFESLNSVFVQAL